MSSSLFRNGSSQQRPQTRGNSRLGNVGQIADIVRTLKNGNPQEIVSNLAKSNPQFAQFYAANKDKSVEQILRDNGVDFSTIMNLLK